MSKANKERDRLLREYGKLYKRLDNCKLDECWYCNDVRQALDHCPPLKQLDYIEVDKFLDKGGKLTLIPSCFECNTILGDKRLMTPGERLSHLYDKYVQKVEKFYVSWSQDEIDELGPALKSAVMAKQVQVNLWVDKARNVETNLIKLETETD